MAEEPRRLESGDPFGYRDSDGTQRVGDRSAEWLNAAGAMARAGGPSLPGLGRDRLDSGDRRRPIMARLSGTASPYSWAEVYPDPGVPGWVTHPAGRDGTENAYEVNEVAGLGGKVVELRPGAPGDYRFQYVRRGTDVGDPIGDDGFGCCAYLPTIDLPGELTIGWPGSDSVATLTGPWEYVNANLQVTSGSEIGPFPRPQYTTAAPGYYVAGPVCWLRQERGFEFVPGGGIGGLDLLVEYERGRGQQVWAVIACVRRVEFPAETPVTRLFLLSNSGQVFDRSRTFTFDPGVATIWSSWTVNAETPDWPSCDDYDPIGEGAIPPDPPYYDYFPVWTYGDGVHLAQNRGGAWVRSDLSNTLAAGEPEFPVESCRPLCLRFVPAPVGVGPTSAPFLSGYLGPGTCIEDHVPGCWVRAILQYPCPGVPCPSDPPTLAIDEESGARYPASVTRYEIEDGECGYIGYSAWVKVPLVDGTHQLPRVFQFWQTDGEGVPTVFLDSVEVEACEPDHTVRTIGDGDAVAPVAFCLTGCPEGAVPGATAVLTLHADGDPGDPLGPALATAPAVVTDSDGCGVALVPLPTIGGAFRYKLEVSPPPGVLGYASPSVFTGPVSLPPLNVGCQSWDIGSKVLQVHPDYVCTCEGLRQRCQRWFGNGSPIEAEYDGVSGWWEDTETATGATTTLGDCEDDTAPAEIPFRFRFVTEGGVCYVEAERTVPVCVIQPPGTFVPPCTEAGGFVSTPRLASGSGVSSVGSRYRAPVDPRGPTEPEGPISLGNATDVWRTPGGDPDPDACFAPAEAYTASVFEPCTVDAGGAPMMMGMGAPTETPPASPRPTAPPPPPRPSGPTTAEMIANAEACPHRVPMPEGEASPCGCRWKCLAGMGPKRRRGGVLLSDCWDCPIAPRITPPADTPDGPPTAR